MPRLHLGSSSTDHRRRSTSSSSRRLSTSLSNSSNNSNDGNGTAVEGVLIAAISTDHPSSLSLVDDATRVIKSSLVMMVDGGGCDDINNNDDDDDGDDNHRNRGVVLFDYSYSSSSSDNDKSNKNKNYKRSNHHQIINSRSSSSSSKSSTKMNTTTIISNDDDEQWIDNFNLLRKCLNPNDGSINYNLLERRRNENILYDDDDDDDDDDRNNNNEVLKKRLRNFVKEQRKQYSIRCNDISSSSSDAAAAGRKNSNNSSGGADERIRLLTEMGFQFRSSETTNKAPSTQEKRLTTKATTKKTVVFNSNGGGGGNDDTWMNDIKDDCLIIDTDDEDEVKEGSKKQKHIIKKKSALKNNNGRGNNKLQTITNTKNKTKGELAKNVTTKKSNAVTKKKSIISLKKANSRDDDNDSPSLSVIGKNAKGRQKSTSPVVAQQTQNEYEVVLPQRILAIDNRVLPSPTYDVMARLSFLKYIPQLIYGGLERGILSSAVTTTTTGDDSNSNTTISRSGSTGRSTTTIASFEYETKTSSHRNDMGVIGVVRPRVAYLFEQQQQCESALQRESGHKENELSSTTTWLADILHPVNVGGRCNNNMLHMADDVDDIEMDDNQRFDRGIIPHTVFAADNSWRYFGDLVVAIIKSKKLSKLPRSNTSRPITLFTTDANLFADVTSASHIRGLEHFWKRICSVFDKRNLTSTTITIIIVETTSAIERLNTIKKYHTSSVGLFDNEITTPAVQHPSRLDVMQCVSDIRRRITELSRQDDGIQLDLEFIEGNSISFQSLLQTWVKDSFDQVYSSSTGSDFAGVRGRLTFDLPETLDGIMCSISLDLQYTVLPNGITSHATQGLIDEMRRLSKLSSSSVEVVQTVALSSVDSSLIYGVPMSARSSLDNDIHRRSEMKMLTRQLWSYLSKNDVALVLRVRTFVDVEEQLFLLVCEEVVQTQPQALDHESNNLNSEAFEIVPDNKCRQGKSLCNGVLYRYATKIQMLRFGNEATRFDAIEDETDMSEHYIDIVERSLDTLIKTGLNPLLMDRNFYVDDSRVLD